MSNDTIAGDVLVHVHQHLARREAELAEQLRHCNFAQAEDDTVDFKVLAQHAADAALQDAQAAQALAELGEIRAARRRMAAGEYGICAGCGEAIDAHRLEALPTATLCTSCRDRQEHAHHAART